LTVVFTVDILVRMNEQPWYMTESIPALMRQARGSYGGAIAAALAEAGFDDVPRTGPFVLGGLIRNGDVGLTELIGALGSSKQTASQLIDTLVVRGYIDRTPDPADRRRVVVSLTERGRAAGDVVGAAVDRVDATLAARITAEQFEGLRAGLATLAGLKRERGAESSMD
jgi:DNA-binding MarR family transcriptional regulator